MCKKCKPHVKYWLHIADDWTDKERWEMLRYLQLKMSGYHDVGQFYPE